MSTERRPPLHKPEKSQSRLRHGPGWFDKFDLIKIPADNKSGEIKPLAIALLNLFADQIYFSSFERYQDFCNSTSLFDGVRCLDDERSVAIDNFVSVKCREANIWTECKFKTSPLRWSKSFVDMRRLSQNMI